MAEVLNIRRGDNFTMPVDKMAAQELINNIAKDSGKIIVIPHCKEQMELRDFTYNDMLTILKNGIIRQEPFKKGKNWRYRLDFLKFNENRDAACVVEIHSNGTKLKAVTMEWIDIKEKHSG